MSVRSPSFVGDSAAKNLSLGRLPIDAKGAQPYEGRRGLSSSPGGWEKGAGTFGRPKIEPSRKKEYVTIDPT